MKEGPCKDIRVRKAISHAIDRKALIAGVDFGLGRPASCNYPEDHWCHNPSLKPVNYDPAFSKKLLDQAGYKNGLTIRGYMSQPDSIHIPGRGRQGHAGQGRYHLEYRVSRSGGHFRKDEKGGLSILPPEVGPGSLTRTS